MRLQLIFLLCFLSLCFLVTASSAYAVTITLSNPPDTVDRDDFSVDVDIKGAEDGTNYLRIDLYKDKDGTKNYFGKTNNGTDLYDGSDGKQYFPITITNKEGSIAVTGNIGEPSAAEYPGPGMYKLRIRRYSSSGSDRSSDDTESPVDIQMIANFSSPSPTPDPTATPNPTPTATPVATKSPTPTPKATATASPLLSKSSPSPSLGSSAKPEASLSEDVLAASSEAHLASSPESSASESAHSGVGGAVLGILLILCGITFSGFGGWLMWKKMQVADTPLVK